MSALGPEQRQRLLAVARATLERALRSGRIEIPPPAPDDPPAPRHVFVTLTRHGRLRGCTGTLAAEEPLTPTIAQLAISSAVRDPRFDPMSPEELDTVVIQISVLDEPVESHPDNMVLGVHGIIVERGRRRALLLPQVAPEQGMSREEFFEAACEKAGLPAGAWREPGTRVLTFTADVFGEHV